jgi:hypothetical protein
MATFYFTNEAADGNWETVSVYYTGSFVFSGQPADGDTVSLYGFTYEFDSDESTSGGTPVAIGASLSATLSNLVTALMADLSGPYVGFDATSTGSAVNISVPPGSEGGSSFSAAGSVITANDLAGGSVGNWRLNAVDGPLATALPTSTDDVYVNGSITGNGSTVKDFTIEAAYYSGTVTFSGTLTVTGVASFIGSDFSSRCINEGTITGNAAFNYYSFNGDTGVVTGNATFDNSSSNLGVVTGNATFSNYSRNGDRYGTAATQGYVGGNATFNDSCTQDSSQMLSFGDLDAAGVGGTATFNDSSRAAGGYCPTAIFNDSSSLGYPAEYDWSWGQVGTATFNDNSYVAAGALQSLYALGVYSCMGSPTFRDNARNNLGLLPSSYEPTPEVTLAYDKGINGSSILGVV